ncbi:MAG TPA: molybdopterin-binding protein [Methylovirgula sp.]|nr:molybdopterin-binding protein [Methylovirgula sp.]
MSAPQSLTAALLVIGDEILSGRTKDKNIGTVADFLAARGIELREVRVVPDEIGEIVAALDAMRRRHTYVFTTGGIGPTHDDVTADAVAAAFGVPLIEDPRALALLLQRVAPDDLNAARRRMARIPQGADLVENTVSKAPGFWIGNVIVMAGVPAIVESMLAAVAPKLKGGAPVISRTIDVGNMPEGAYAAELALEAARHPEVSVGSYPAYREGKFANQIVVRGKGEAQVEAAVEAIQTMIAKLRAAGKDKYTIT